MSKDTNFCAEIQGLSPEHLRMLREGSSISGEVIAARGYRTITDVNELEQLGFSRDQCRVPGLLLPVHCTDGGNSLYVYRPDNPRESWSGKGKDYKHKVIKYEIPKGVSVRLDCPSVCQPLLANPQIPLWITEGQKKADALASHKQCVIDLLGVWNFKGHNAFGGITLLSDFDYIAWDGRDVRIVFDSDVMTKPQVHQALERLKEHLQRKGAQIGVVYLPKSENGKNGVDDYLASGHNIDDLLALLEAPRPLPQPAAPMVELLDIAPAALRRPLAMINGRAYAAIWPHVQITRTEKVQKDGTIVRLDPPTVKSERRLFVVCDDGKIFGDANGCESFAALGIEVCLPEIPCNDKLWSTVGFKSYRAGKRPDACDVFTRIGAIINRFIDFDHSLASQETMCEMMGCYILSTWFLEAFNVVGYLWPNGDKGSGKTHLLTIVAELSYLGQVILAGGSYASLRDLADYGATLAFDDAEGLADVKRTDPDKRALLLAGNRRGSVISVKEMGPDELWPFDKRQLLDNLWALALHSLPELPKYDQLVSQHAALSGRNLEPWRALLAVAFFLQDQGIDGLFERLNQLSVSYQRERTDLETNDLTILTIRALCQCANDANCANHEETLLSWTFETDEFAKVAAKLAADLEIDLGLDLNLDSDLRKLKQRLGHVLRRFRLQKSPRIGGKGCRKWRITKDDLERLKISYNISDHTTL